MAEYIERDAAIAVLRHLFTPNKSPAQREMLRTAGIGLSRIPAADVVEVVRCADCKHYHLGTAYCNKHSYFVDSDGVSCSPAESPNWTMWDADDYCSDGERRDGHEV